MVAMNKARQDRFWAKVEKTDACWLWTGAINSKGYGVISWREGGGKKNFYAHRLSLELAGEPPFAGAQCDHVCHVRACVNPSHLRWVTAKQNKENYQGLMRTNTSGHRGVTWDAAHGAWKASARHCGRLAHAGLYATREQAAEAARAKRLELHTHNDADRVRWAHTLPLGR